MTTHLSRLWFGLLALLLSATLLPAQTQSQPLEGRQHPLSKTEQALAKQAKLTFEEAKKVALEKVPGTIFNWELEKENGKIIYSIVSQLPDDKIYCREVNVNAMTGKIVAVEKENLKRQLKLAGKSR